MRSRSFIVSGTSTTGTFYFGVKLREFGLDAVADVALQHELQADFPALEGAADAQPFFQVMQKFVGKFAR